MEIKIFSVGGTIDKVYFDELSDYRIGEPAVTDILGEGNVSFAYTVESLMRKDSLDMADGDRELIRRRVADNSHRLILITHGTDTMIRTAMALTAIAGKVIVLTGALVPARFKSSDAMFNIGTAVGALQSLPCGVYIVMNGRVFDPARIRKNRSTNQFEPVEPKHSERQHSQ